MQHERDESTPIYVALGMTFGTSFRFETKDCAST